MTNESRVPYELAQRIHRTFQQYLMSPKGTYVALQYALDEHLDELAALVPPAEPRRIERHDIRTGALYELRMLCRCEGDGVGRAVEHYHVLIEDAPDPDAPAREALTAALGTDDPLAALHAAGWTIKHRPTEAE